MLGATSPQQAAPRALFNRVDKDCNAPRALGEIGIIARRGEGVPLDSPPPPEIRRRGKERKRATTTRSAHLRFFLDYYLYLFLLLVEPLRRCDCSLGIRNFSLHSFSSCHFSSNCVIFDCPMGCKKRSRTINVFKNCNNFFLDFISFVSLSLYSSFTLRKCDCPMRK